jgi:rhombotail lipoprotein
MHKTASTLLLCLVAGCATPTKHTSTSAVQFLYPDAKERVDTPSVPTLRLPLRVGIAFVPGTLGNPNLALTEKRKTDVLDEVARHFRSSPFVKTIEVIPSAYLRPRGSFANLDQIRTMYGVDVIALVSYDQTQFTDQGLLSLTYWTVVGAYIVRGQKNDTHTMLDTVLYDIASRKLLFRAPGLSEIKARSTYVNMSEQLRKDSNDGVTQATADMIANLDSQLTAFQAKVKERPEEFRVVSSPSYRGGGGIDLWLLALVVTGAAGSVAARRR